MTDRYEEWRDFYAEKVRSWMSLDEIRAECGKLQTADATSPEVLLIHAMHLLERYEQRNEAMRADVKRLRTDLMESDEIREKLGHLLTRTAAALKGEPPAGVWHSWHDLPERAALATSLADDAAESVICTVGRSPRERQWVLYPEQIAADPYLADAIAHLEWRGIAKAVREDGRVTVIFEEQP